MLIVETEHAMSELARKLAEELKTKSYRDLEGEAHVSRGAIEKIVKGRNEDYPKLETLDKLATYWKLPLWRVIEMAGIGLGRPALPRSIAARAGESMYWSQARRPSRRASGKR